ncbi:gliding motility-associated C-terminal domain-containing protein [Maribacter sp. TH_r10]|uniref:gliding motility-associated C-terminal domain-containing protein n=1 Tax=Maribacter sp. TH_r10 TaxID=3082086 RepID=UPI002952C7D3|nr:gliding motility-associated C-terminal domain-containing protein [Maribacter sp. TH_r10]MDV7140262.1 gliding motility-associated C-terminal domain-containing protein [Maribacter sp. TH_r10]
MTNLNLMKTLLQLAFVLCILLFSTKTMAQCAGTDNTVTICTKDADETNKTFDLFTQLGGSPTTGGTWSTNDPANFYALDRNTGILNLWDVKNSGQHEFTYTNDCSGNVESATITINLGGYPGEDNIDGSADACGDDPRVNLHGYIGDETEGKFQDFNGTWDAVTPEAAPYLSLNFFDAASAGPGIYEFTHTVPAVGPCPSRQARLILEVQRPANSGIGSNLTVCTTDDLSGYTDFNLNGLLEDEDINGTWSEGPNTDQLSDLTDQNIDIQAIRDRHTYGTFTFTYTVYPSHAVCDIHRTQVEITILPTLIATMNASNFCSGDTKYRIDITDYDDTLIGNGTYSVTYGLSSASGTNSETTALILNNDKTGSFQIDANLVQTNETTTLSIISLGEDVCPDIQVSPIQFIETDPMVDVTDACEANSVSVTLSDIFDPSYNLANGTYDVNYTITAPSGTETVHQANAIAFSSGRANFTIPATQILETGEYTFNFEVENGFPLDCEITDTAMITPIPEAIDLNLLVDNSCNATSIDVMVSAPTLDDGAYEVTYEVISQETNTILINNSINFNGGTADYEIDVTTLEQGNYTVTVKSTQNDTTPCRTEFDFEISENFAVEGVPALPEAEAVQTFCLAEYSPGLPTLQDIIVIANGEMLFYDTATDMDILPLDTELVDGEDYFISNIDPNNNCEGSDRIQVTVNLSDPESPTLLAGNPTFCGSENPTVTDLNTSVSSSGEIVWYESATDGTALSNDTALTNGKSYYAATEINGLCQSSERIEITPTVYELEAATLEFSTLALCGLDDPTITDLREAESDSSYTVLWYDTPENGTPLDDSTLLTTGTTYYAESYNPDTGCMNPERMAITIDLTNCEPEDYGFFIPDGFSPNGDGRNDTFFVPNIEVIFPEFTLEILNRYGTSLFKGDRNKPAWNGKNGNNTAPNGVYFYIIDYNKEGHTPVQGRLYLNR